LTTLDAGWAALGRGDWAGARTAFECGLADGETPEALEGIGWAGHMLGEERLTIDSRERAYRQYLDRGDRSSAARVASLLAADCLMFRGEAAVANGWLQRAHSLIDDLEPGVDHGWLAIHEGHIAVSLTEDTAKARQLAAQAIELGRTFGAPELEMLGLGLEGRALVSDGELDEGMRRLDEATTVALDGEARLLYCVAWACCYLISACERVRDYERAAEWCGRVGDFCGQHDIFLLNICRAHYASVLSWQGRWDEAETQLNEAVGGLRASRPPMVGDALARLGELRRRQGRLAEAEELFAQAESHTITLLGRAQLALDRDQAEEAAELADRYLRRFPERGRVERSAGLEVAARAFAACRDLERSEDSLSELRGIAARAKTRPIQAALYATEGALAAARADHNTARCSFEDAIDLLTACDAAYDAGRVHLANGAMNGFLLTPATSLTRGDLQIASYFQATDPETTVILHDRPLAPSLMTIVAKRRIVLGWDVRYSAVGGEGRLRDVNAFFASADSADPEPALEILRRYHVTHVLVRSPEDRVHPAVLERLQLVMRYPEVALYRVPSPARP